MIINPSLAGGAQGSRSAATVGLRLQWEGGDCHFPQGITGVSLVLTKYIAGSPSGDVLFLSPALAPLLPVVLLRCTGNACAVGEIEKPP